MHITDVVYCDTQMYVIFLLGSFGGQLSDHMSPEGALISNLLTSYHKRGTYGRPIFNYSKAVPVKFQLQLIQIMGLSEKDQIFKISVWTNYVSGLYRIKLYFYTL